MGRSPDIEIIFLIKAWSFSKKSEDGPVTPNRDHLLRKAWSFLIILSWAGHPIMRPLFLQKAWSFSKKS